MATTTVARPAQALRRRDAPRPSLAKRSTMDAASGQPAKKRQKLEEPYVWDSQYILQKHKGKAPSLTIHLHPTNFKFEGQDGSFPYDSEMKFLLEHVRNKSVPHQMMQELLENNIPFYDGCLIVEIHDHRKKESKTGNRKDSGKEGDTVRFGMHNYNEHVTPSPFVPYPKKAARLGDTPEKTGGSSEDMPAPEKPKAKDGPKIFTTVLHGTQLSKHHEMIVLANTPASEVRSKKRGSDSGTPSSAQPQTPQLSVPPTPITQTGRGQLPQSQKMCLEEGDLYSFQADLLMATEPPLYLEPVDNPQDAQKVLDLLAHPLHQEKPPSPKTRKRTTAEVAADDAQAQETERRMLIMDERIKPLGAGAAANDSQGAAASLTFSRFKTIEMSRQKLDEQERTKKEEELRAAAEKKQQEEQTAMQQRAAYAQKQRDLAHLAHQQQQLQQQQQQQQQPSQQQQILMQQQRQEQLRARAVAQAQQQQLQGQVQPQNHAHPQQNAMIQNQQQNFQHNNQVSMPQSSPIVRQQTPMMNSSPMMQQGGFAMAQTSSQGAGSPPRPTSGMQHPNPMARQVSQQQRGSQSNTPSLPQGTPSMHQAIPNRQMTQTPRMPPGSPAAGMQQGTPTPGGMPMSTPHIANGNQLNPEQIAMIQQQRAALSQGGGQAGSPPQSMTPEQIQNIQHHRRQQQLHNHQQILAAQAAQANGNPQLAAQMQQMQRQKIMMQQQRHQQLLQAQQNSQMHGSPSVQAGSPGQMPQQTPQMGHAHPQQQFPGQQGNMQNMSPQEQQQAYAAAQARATQLAQMRGNNQMVQLARQQLQPLVTQYGGLQNIPPQVIAGLPDHVRVVYQQTMQNNRQRHQAALRAQQAQQQQQNQQGGAGGGGNGEQVPAQQPNPQYMQQLRQNQQMLAQHHANMQQQQQQQQQGGMNNMAGMSFHMNGMGQNFGNQQGAGNDLTQQFAAMQNALNRSTQGGGQGAAGGQQGGMQ